MFKILLVGFFACLGCLTAEAAGNLVPSPFSNLAKTPGSIIILGTDGLPHLLVPTTSGQVLYSNGPNQLPYFAQPTNGSGGAVSSVNGKTGAVQIVPNDISGLAASATTDTTNAANISVGVLPYARLPIGADVGTVMTTGAVCNGASDDTNAIMAAATKFSGYIKLPVGSCGISNLSFTGIPLRIVGAGTGLTTLRLLTSSGSNSITINGSGGIVPNSGNYSSIIENLTIDASNNNSMNQYAIVCNNASGMMLDNIVFNKVPNWLSSNCNDVVSTRVTGFDLATNGVGYDINSGTFSTDYQRYESTTPGGPNSEALAWIRAKSTTALLVGDHGIIEHVLAGIYLNPNAGQTVQDSSIGSMQFDQCGNKCIQIEPNGGTVQNILLKGSWASTANMGISAIAGSGFIDKLFIDHARSDNAINISLNVNGISNLIVDGGSYSGSGYHMRGSCTTTTNKVTITDPTSHDLTYKDLLFNDPMGNQTINIDGTNYTITNIEGWDSNNHTVVDLATSTGSNTVSGRVCIFDSSQKIGIALTNVSTARISNVKSTSQSVGSGLPQFGIVDYGGNTNLQIVGNDFSNNSVLGLSSSSSSPTYTNTIIHDNKGVDDFAQSLTAANTLAVGFGQFYNLSGTTNVNTISGPSWQNRIINILPSATTTFNTSSTIGNTYTTTANVLVTMIFSSGKWYFK